MAVQTLTFETYLSVGSAVAAFISALLWVIAARARVPHDPKPDKDGWFPASISVDGDDFIETVKKQGELNRWAAYAAAVAAALQGTAILVPVLIEWAQ
jgi:hypothetical protein